MGYFRVTTGPGYVVRAHSAHTFQHLHFFTRFLFFFLRAVLLHLARGILAGLLSTGPVYAAAVYSQ